jgi:hypothetical protein
LARLRWLLEGDIAVSSLRISRRYLAILTIVALVKLLLAAIVEALGPSFWMNFSRVEPLPQNQIFLTGGVPHWVYTFLGWDSAWYASIAAHGYSFSGQSYAFLPGFPIFTQLLQPLFSGTLVALVTCSLIVGLLWVPLYQSVAEHYIGRDAAMVSALVFALSPFTLLFTTVAYSEGLFLLVTLAAWKLYLDERYLPASVAAGVAALIRIPGFLTVLPMFLTLFSSRKSGSRRRAFLVTLPTLVALLSWFAYMDLSAGGPLAIIHTTEWSSLYNLPTYISTILPWSGAAALSFPGSGLEIHWLLPISIWSSILLPPLLAWRVARIERALAIYCFAYIASIFAFGGVVSYPRFMAILFPLWLPFSELVARKRFITPVLVAASVASCLALWLGFVSGVFVG